MYLYINGVDQNYNIKSRKLLGILMDLVGFKKSNLYLHLKFKLNAQTQCFQ
ncbi:hypothetical protein FORMA_15240 [Formosa sp. Hel3_A1_48]|nr:hypothetical protein FORMA_15240 [Formosa sp. Hel3_A1_48]